MADDTTREILGFDPDTGERNEDRGRLSPVVDPKEPDKVREAFVRFAENLRTENPDTQFQDDPEHLLLVAEKPEEVKRHYYFPLKNIDSPDWQLRETARFGQKNGVWQPLTIARRGEHHLRDSFDF